jgi:excisionase family DNA binding protein
MIEADLTTDEVAAVLRLHRVTIQRWLKSGRLRGYQVGRTWRVPRQAVEEIRQSGAHVGGSESPTPADNRETYARWEAALLSEEDLAAVPPIPAEALRRESLYEERD